jgi:hypothetical protein
VSWTWSPGRLLGLVLMATVWAAFGTGVYRFLGSHRSALSIQAKKPGEDQSRNGPISRLPGTLYIVQDGALYRLQRGTFASILNAPGGAARWIQPSLSADGQSLVVVRRDYAFSDLYSMDASGHGQRQLTRNSSKTVELNHWVFYPRLSADGGSVFFSYDPKDRSNNYNVVLAAWQMPVGGQLTQAKKWTTPNSYTGGDIQPIPLAAGGLVYTKYTFDQPTNAILSQIWLTPRAGVPGRALTPAGDDCSQPALSPDGQRLAMICTGGKQFANLEIASLGSGLLGPRQVLVGGQLAAQPAWAPDGSGLVYLAPAGISGHFQLWFQQAPQQSPPPTAEPTTRPARARAATPTPTPTPAAVTPTATPTPLPAVRLTSDNDFDATSTIAWHA